MEFINISLCKVKVLLYLTYPLYSITVLAARSEHHAHFLATLYKANYNILTDKISAYLHKWLVLLLTISANQDKCATHAISFSNTGPHTTKKYVYQLISSFIRQGGHPCVRYKALQLSKQHGGWGLSHLRLLRLLLGSSAVLCIFKISDKI